MPGLAMRWPPYALGTNASGAATEALSAPPADPTLEVPTAMANAAPTTGVAPLNARGFDFPSVRRSQPCQQARERQEIQVTQVR